MTNKDTFDKILDSLLDEALPIVESMPDKNLPEGTDAPFTEEDERRERAILEKERAALRAVHVRAYLKRAAVCAATLILLCAILVMSVSALRAPVLNFVTKTTKESTDITLPNTDDASTSDAQEIYNTDSLSVGYIPEGFSLAERDIKERSVYLLFSNGTQTFDICIYSNNSTISINTEDACIERMYINNHPALYSENDVCNIITMYDDNYVYIIEGTIDKDNLVQIAQNLKKY